MKLFRKIGAKTGNLLEDMLFESHPFLMETVLVDVTDQEGTITQVEETRPILDAEGNALLDPQYVEEAPPQGLYLPRYLNGVWVEGGVAPEPTVPKLSTDEKLTQMAEQLVITQTELEATTEALDFLLMGVIQKNVNFTKNSKREKP